MTVAPCRDANRVNEEWFTDMEKVRAAVGMVDEAPEPPGTTDKVSVVAAERIPMNVLWNTLQVTDQLSPVQVAHPGVEYNVASTRISLCPRCHLALLTLSPLCACVHACSA